MTELTSPTLGAAISISKGKKHEISESPTRTAKRLIGIDDLRNDDLIRYTEDSSGVEVTPGDVLIAWDGANAGTIGFGKSGYIGSTIARLRLKVGIRLFTPFLGFYLKSKFDYLRQTATGATIPHIKRSALENIPLPNIDFNDQIRIAHLLGKVEGLIAQRKQHLQQLDDLLKSVFLEMFGDPVRNEKGWEPTTIGQIIKVASGTGLVAKDMNTEGPYKVYGGNGVNGTHTEYMFDSPTLAIGRVGYYCGSVHITEPKSWVTDNALYVKEFLKKTDLVFIKHLLATHDLNKAAGRAAQPLVSGSRIYPIRTIDVPFENQKAFSTIVERVEALKSRYQQSLADLKALYGALSQQAFKGELDLSRVALSAAPVEGEKPAALPVPIAAQVIELPETDLLPPALQDRTQLAPLLRFWLEAYTEHLGDMAFSVDQFMRDVETRVEEAFPDRELKLDSDAYDLIKKWVFEALSAGRLEQVYPNRDDDIRVALRKPRAVAKG